MNSEKMCDCNQGRLACACRPVCDHLWRGLEAGNAQCDKCWAIKSADGSVSEPADELILPVVGQHQDAPTCRGDKRLGTGCGKCSLCVSQSSPVERDEPRPRAWEANGALFFSREAAIRAAEKTPVIDLYDRSVISKLSKLVAQLQADLTARDERIDQLESQFMPGLHSRPEERGEPEKEPCSGCGAQGWTGNCPQCIPY